MKYNLSEIMKRAWKIVKLAKTSFADALKFSWRCAKKERSMKETCSYPEEEYVRFKIWARYGLVRAYYTRSWVSNYQNSKTTNYIEM